MNKHVIKRLDEWTLFNEPLIVATEGKVYLEFIAPVRADIFIEVGFESAKRLVASDIGRFSLQVPGRDVLKIFTDTEGVWVYVRDPHQMVRESASPSFTTAAPLQTESDEMRAIKALTRKFSELQMSNEDVKAQLARSQRREAKLRQREERKEERQERKEERQEKRKGKADEPNTGSPETSTEGLSDEGQTHDT
jgi:hypothetical protein